LPHGKNEAEDRHSNSTTLGTTSVAVAAERVGESGGVVEVLTSDVVDLRNLSVHV